jgi:hypothetical protein
MLWIDEVLRERKYIKNRLSIYLAEARKICLPVADKGEYIF